jgi:hypothetical protein
LAENENDIYVSTKKGFHVHLCLTHIPDLVGSVVESTQVLVLLFFHPLLFKIVEARYSRKNS